jgi:NADH-quinone oxidoreductase subunit L
MNALPLVLALPLAGVVLLALGGRWLRGRVAGWVATALVGLSFALAVAIGAQYVRLPTGMDAGEVVAPTVVQTLWRWMAVGNDMVEVTVATQPLAPAEAIPPEAVGRVWVPPDLPGVAETLPRMWDEQAVAGQQAGQAPIAPLEILIDQNVPPDEGGFVPATPQRQHAFVVDVALQLDGLSLLMMLVVTGVGFLIHLYSIGYMAGDADVRRYFVYLNLFIFSMLTLVLAANYLVMFVGWELVGACSYLLIGFWYRDPVNATAGRKAFIVNRVGDFAFLIGLMLLWSTFGTLAYAEVFALAPQLLATNGALAVTICLLLLIGATGKSAQLPLYVWLPDAMAGPTPVSALIHAATMVTAGVYMIARSHVLYEQAPAVLALVAVVGAATALLAAVLAVVQVDIKRVLAYSTISQLGYMFLALGAGAYVAAIFHLTAHAFFKALLFLGAGSVMHALEHGFHAAHEAPEPVDGVPAPQDMRRMGGLLARIPLTGWTFVIGGLALAGVFPLAGFWSKDEILYETLRHGGRQLGLWTVLYLVALVTAFLTAFYTGRQLMLVLAGRPRSRGAEGARDSPALMTAPLVILAGLTVVGGALGLALVMAEPPIERLLAPVLGARAAAEGLGKLAVALLASVVTLAGLGLAWLAYRDRPAVDPARVSAAMPRAYRVVRRGFYVDEVYTALFVRPFRALADFFWLVVDDGLVDGAVNGIAWLVGVVAQWSRRAQTGYVRQYLLSILLGAVLMAIYLFMKVM